MREFTRSCFFLPQKRVVPWNAVRGAVIVVLNINSERFAQQCGPILSIDREKALHSNLVSLMHFVLYCLLSSFCFLFFECKLSIIFSSLSAHL